VTENTNATSTTIVDGHGERALSIATFTFLAERGLSFRASAIIGCDNERHRDTSAVSDRQQETLP
jgi:hypothetical protein